MNNYKNGEKVRVAADILLRRVRIRGIDPLKKKDAFEVAGRHIKRGRLGSWERDVAVFGGSYHVVDCYYRRTW